MKTWKLQRDTKALIIQQIDWLNQYRKVDLSADDVKSLYSKEKKELIEIWENTIKECGYPQLEWLEIYY
jgi:hypothetical protein